MRSAFLLVAALLVGACDSGAPAPPTTPPPATPTPTQPSGPTRFTVSGLPSSVEYEVGDEDEYIPTRYFEPSYPADMQLEFSVVGAQLTFERESNRVNVSAVGAGDAEIRIAASADGYRDTTLVIPIRVIPGVCPTRPAGAPDLFPIATGESWRFQYALLDEGPASYQDTRTTGTYTLTRTGETCYQSRRTLQFEESIQGTRRSGSFSEPVSETGPLRLYEYPNREVVIRLQPERFIVTGVRFPRYTDGTTGRFRFESTDTNGSVCGFDSFASHFEFETGRGLIEESVNCTRSDGRRWIRSLVRLP